MPDRDNYANNSSSGGISSETSNGSDDICRDFLRNVCKRGKRCRFRHPDISEISDLGVKKNEFIFCHDFQNKECVRHNCKFIHSTKEDQEYYKKTGELPLHLRQKVAAGLGLSPADLAHNKGDVPICRDYMKGECQRGAKCKFRHIQQTYEYDNTVIERVPLDPGPPVSVRRYDRYEPYDGVYDTVRYDPYEPLLKRRRIEGMRYETYEYGHTTTRVMDYRYIEEENIMLRRRVEELKKQVSNLMAANEVLLDQNAQYRNQAKVMTLSSTPAATEQPMAPTVGTVTNFNHGIAQTHTTLSSQSLQPRAVSQQELVAPTGAPTAPPTNAAPPTAPHLNPEITPLSAALAQTIAQGMAPPVSMAPVAVSVAPVAVSMAQPLPVITMSHATTPMVTYPIASQSMRITPMPH
ncbi:zinc finger CCCH domain-containing protein 10 [Latimeria chalumnae]|uniref:Zinc finger CCCH domain-containing protein 10 n=1 Tax=Latimeria chalumnae TaxID=7897 RepID=H2ZZ51_LATCH|nr:PREDICTED: zinc finger CCCH domain-containing protein 10 [Latimeria chalumnae]|eukprot:XP_006013834.1 PREDICTED: zinc finger CCCH domain-containing protein 10 [Latimeria chalumnae]